MEDAWLFAKLEIMRLNKNFESCDDLATFLFEVLSSIPKTDFKAASKKLKNNSVAVINANGSYVWFFEK